MTKHELKQYKHLTREIEQLTLALEKVRGDMEGVKSPTIDGMPRSGRRGLDLDERLTRLLCIERMINEKIDKRYDLQIAIEKAIDTLTPLEASVIRLRYIVCYSWERIALELDYSIHHVWRLHGQILKKMRENER